MEPIFVINPVADNPHYVELTFGDDNGSFTGRIRREAINALPEAVRKLVPEPLPEVYGLLKVWP